MCWSTQRVLRGSRSAYDVERPLRHRQRGIELDLSHPSVA